jgi:hypothetical protein
MKHHSLTVINLVFSTLFSCNSTRHHFVYKISLLGHIPYRFNPLYIFGIYLAKICFNNIIHF